MVKVLNEDNNGGLYIIVLDKKDASDVFEMLSVVYKTHPRRKAFKRIVEMIDNELTCF